MSVFSSLLSNEPFSPLTKIHTPGSSALYCGESLLNRTAWREGTMRVFELLGILGLLVLVYVVSGRPD
jgi:hypothetical protein